MLSEQQKSIVKFQSYTELKMTNRGGTVDAGPKGPLNLVPCQIPAFLTVITVLGNVLPCFEDFHEELVMGNIGSSHLKDIWAGEKFQKLRQNLKIGKRHAQSPCDKCNRTQVLYDRGVHA